MTSAMAGTGKRPSTLSALRCSRCTLGMLCLPSEFAYIDSQRLDALVSGRRHIKRGTYLYRVGDPFTCLYAVNKGCLKNSARLEDGRDQLTGFQQRGELVGFDGIATQRHTMDVVAQENSTVCVIPFAPLEDLLAQSQALQRQLHRIMSRQIVRDHHMLALLSTKRAEHRLALFLLGLAARSAPRGRHLRPLRLTLNRRELGSYLGLTFETVSRTLSRFQERGLVRIERKLIRHLDLPGLESLIARRMRRGNSPRLTSVSSRDAPAIYPIASNSHPVLDDKEKIMVGELFAWADEFKVDIQEVDEQHRVLVSLLNQLYNALRERQDVAACGEILNRLTEYTRMHFLLEESLMRLTHYPGFVIHKQQHEELMEQMHALQAKLDAQTASITFELLHFLRLWLTQHILDSDKRFGAYFNRSGLSQYAKWSSEVNEAMKKKRWWWKFW